VYLFPIDWLQRLQMGTRFWSVVGPPFDSGILCPAWAVKTVIEFGHQLVAHLASNTRPFFWSQTASRKAFGIGFLT
jgi:hypothetical protein